MIFAQVPLFPDQASTDAPRVDALLYFLLGLSVFFTVLIAWLIVRYAIKYRRRSEHEVPTPMVGSIRLELVWTVAPLLIGLFTFAWGAWLFFDMTQPPDNALPIYVVGKQWMWKVQHPDGQREINELHVPVGEPVKLTMISEDVIHSFYVPAFRIKQDVLPGRYSMIWFQATKPGRYHLFCAEYCGTEHSRMIGSVVVLEKDEYRAWLESHAEGSPALEGRKLFLKLKCIACHAGDQPAYGPLLEGLYGKTVRLNDGTEVEADLTYLRESILDPQAKVVVGHQAIMPTYRGQVSEEEVLQLIEFIKSLQPGQTPRRTPDRVEKTSPPIAAPKAPGGARP